MKRSLRSLPALLLLFALPLSGQSFQEELALDLENQKSKWIGLFDAMPDDAMTWRPGEGVRSVSEVFMHIALANFMIPGAMGAEMPDGMRPEWQTEREQVSERASIRQALEMSFDHIIGLANSSSDADIEAAVNLFGRDTNARGAMMLIQTHCHEHLGQMIAYARTNGVAPPWSM